MNWLNWKHRALKDLNKQYAKDDPKYTFFKDMIETKFMTQQGGETDERPAECRINGTDSGEENDNNITTPRGSTIGNNKQTEGSIEQDAKEER
jgi:hypothetical protein